MGGGRRRRGRVTWVQGHLKYTRDNNFFANYEGKGELITSVLTRNFISVSLQDRIRCKTRIFLLPALPLPDIALTRKDKKK
jgi:hypothetical protein